MDDRCSQGEIVVHIWDRLYVLIEETLEVRAEVNVHEIEVSRSCGIALVIRDGSAAIPWNTDWGHPIVARPDGPSGSRSWSTVSGTWQVTLPELPGFEPAPMQTVDVPRGSSRSWSSS